MYTFPDKGNIHLDETKERNTEKQKITEFNLAMLNLKHLWDDSQMSGILYTNVSGVQNMDWERSYDRLTVPET